MIGILSLLLLLSSSLFLLCVVVASASNLDRFNYDQTINGDGVTDYGPRDWEHVECSNLDDCLGWPDKYPYARGFSLKENHCRWCPDNRCGTHHQSPINLQRNRALDDHPAHNECIDVHWMAYYDSSCSFEELQSKRSFLIDRHALRINQPITLNTDNNQYFIDCRDNGGTRRWGKIDFSKGFSAWWHLSHIDFHLPSEHTQEGKRYSAELQMYHFYSKTFKESGVHNEMAAVSIFLEAYDDADDWKVLNKIICAWRQEEEMTRHECGKPSVTTNYPGCLKFDRTSTTRRRTQSSPLSAYDVILNNVHTRWNRTFEFNDHDEDDMHDFDWESFLNQTLEQQQESSQNRRKLLNYDHVPWFNYFAMLAVRTEYYYRYSGTQTIPPCYGKWFENNDRQQTNHWRIMKDPIRVSHRQIAEMHRLIKNRIAPVDDPLNPCQPDTAAKVSGDTVDTARPLQSFHKAHFKVFCECQDWKSKWPQDQAWCQMDQLERYYDHPYNFETNDF